MPTEDLNLVRTAVSYCVESTSIQGSCCPITMMTSHKFLPGFNIRARGVFQGKMTVRIYLYFFGSVSHFLRDHLHQYCVPNSGL